MNTVIADLHLHTIASDGRYAPLVLCELLKLNGIKFFSLTDHDSVRSVAEAVEWAEMNGMTNIPGVEYSTFNSGRQIHILGYMKDYKKAGELLDIRKKDRIERAKKMVDLLNENNIKIDFEDVLIEAKESESVGRPHIARAMLKNEQIADLKEAFDRYIGDNKCCYVPKMEFTIRETVEMIHSLRGLAVMAHPFENEAYRDLEEIYSMGIDGLEVYTPKNRVNQIDFLLDFAKPRKLLITGGSDYHGDNIYTPTGLHNDVFEIFLEKWRSL
ncbi:MAG: PHP domain-containing protein [bacterium]